MRNLVLTAEYCDIYLCEHQNFLTFFIALYPWYYSGPTFFFSGIHYYFQFCELCMHMMSEHLVFVSNQRLVNLLWVLKWLLSVSNKHLNMFIFNINTLHGFIYRCNLCHKIKHQMTSNIEGCLSGRFALHFISKPSPLYFDHYQITRILKEHNDTSYPQFSLFCAISQNCQLLFEK